MKTTKMLTILFVAGCLMLWAGQFAMAGPIGTAFTYQGRLIDANKAADGLYDFQFKLFDANSDGNKLGLDINEPNEDVIDGYFTVELDFGSVFDGNDRWLLIGVRPGIQNDPNVYTTLTPRQKVTPTPYALYAKTAGGGGSLWQVNGTSIYYNNGNVGIGTSNPAAKLDVSGDISAASVYKIGGSTVLSAPGTQNTLVGLAAGAVNTGSGNTFTGYQAGAYNTTGNNNTFSGVGTGYSSGSDNTFSGFHAGYWNTGSRNTYVGREAGATCGDTNNNTFVGYMAGYSSWVGDNSFFGYMAGYTNTTGSYNTFLGENAGHDNNTGNYNTFSGYLAGYSNTTGYMNTFSGVGAGRYNTQGNDNTFSGVSAGHDNTTGSGNVFIGYDAGYSETGSNKLYIANSTPGALIYGDFSTGQVGISLTAPTEALDVNGTARLRGIGSSTGTTVVADATGKLWKLSSSQRYKTNIESLDTGADAVLKMRPVRFEYKESGQKDIGLIAEEVEKISPDLVIYDGQGRPDAVKYDKVALYLLSVIKNQQQENESMKARLATLETLVAKMSLQKEGGIK